MKNLLFTSLILLSSVTFITSCKKESDALPQNNLVEVAIENNLLPSTSIPLPENAFAGRGKPIKQPTSGNVKCLYFDFDGETVHHAMWNGGATFHCQPSTMTAEAKADAMYRVQLAYANYNVTVTDQLSVYNNASMRQRIIVTPTSAWYPGCSGVAGIGSIFSSSPAPAFVFTDRLYENTKYIGDIMMHESGHTVGLRHQSEYSSTCQLVNSYRPSTIMGYPFDLPQAPWVYGTSTSCTTYQDDNAILTQNLGLR